MARDTLIDFLRDLTREHGTFLVYDDGFRSRRYGYDEIGRAATRFAARLRAEGLSKGDTVVFWSENRPEWIAAFWGCLLEGVVVVPIDYRASPDFLARVSRIVSARIVLVGDEVGRDGDHDGSPSVSARAAAGATVWRLHELEWPDAAQGREGAAGGPAEPRVPIAHTDVAEIIFTSGATAEPKGVVITHANILANIVPVEREIQRYRKWARPFSPLRFLNLLPLSHMFGQAMAAFIPPILGGEVIFMRGYNPVDIIEEIKTRRVSVLVSVPKILDVLSEYVTRVDAAARAALADAEKSAARERPAWHFVFRWWRYRRVHRLFGPKFWAFVVGAAPLDPELEALWSELGFAVVQGYGLTETAPIVSLNHPFSLKRGSVGKPIEGVEVKIAPDGEILVRGENVTKGYFKDSSADNQVTAAFDDGWFHTGDIGEMSADGQLYIRGRKKEMIVTPEGLNVFPEDVERVLSQILGVRDSAVVGAPVSANGPGTNERVHAVLVLDPGVDPEAVAREANARLDDHQKIRRVLVWPDTELPRTEGTRKLKRSAVREWVRSGNTASARHPGPASADHDRLATLLARYAGRTDLSAGTTIDELGLSSLDRVELMVALEDAFQAPIDESAFAGARDIGQLRTVVERAATGGMPPPEPMAFPTWNRSWLARTIRRMSLPVWILPIARLFAWIRIEGRDRLQQVEGPVIFAANHQSFMDAPVIMAALPPRLRYRVAPAMAKEFFEAHFHPGTHGRLAWFTNSLNYYLAALFFDAFPLPQREAGARQTLRYIGDLLEAGFSVLIFPEGEMTLTGEMGAFRPGIGMIAERLGVPVVPVRIEGLDKVLHRTWRMARPGHVRIAFGAPLCAAGTASAQAGGVAPGQPQRSGRDAGHSDYEAIAKRVEAAVRAL